MERGLADEAGNSKQRHLARPIKVEEGQERKANQRHGGKSGHPESNQGPSDGCMDLQSDALPAEL